MPTLTSLGLKKYASGEPGKLAGDAYNMDLLNALTVAIQAGLTPANLANLAAFAARLDNFGPDIKTLGAVGDGATDDSATFIAQDLNYPFIHVPAGNYLIDDWVPGAGAEFWGPGILKISVESGTRRDFTLPAAPGQWIPSVSLGELKSKMAMGDAVNIAAFGDSTTDGNNTTGWTANPVTEVEGQPWTKEPVYGVDYIDHNTTAPNTWPVKLQTLLRDFYDNASIAVHNAGFSGQRLQNGWACTFYERAIQNNSNYGLPDMVLIQFGLNDANVATDISATFISETEKLIKRVIGYGGLPVLLSCDAIWEQNVGNNFLSAGYENSEVLRTLDAIKQGLAKEYNIPFIDVSELMANFIVNNEQNLSWIEMLSDELHMGNTGHAYKAGAVAMHLMRGFYEVSGGRIERVMALDGRSGFPFGEAAVYAVGATDPSYSRARHMWNIVDADYAGTENIFDFWVYCHQPCSLIYRSTCSNNGLTGIDLIAMNTMSRIKVDDAIAYGTPYFDDVTPGSGLKSVHHSMDRPYFIVEMHMGLNRVRMTTPTTGDLQQWGGFFELNPFWMNERNFGGYLYISAAGTATASQRAFWQKNALRDTGEVFWPIAEDAVDGYFCWAPQESFDGANCIGLAKENDKFDILVRGKFPPATGFVFCSGRGYDADDTTDSLGERSVMAYFSAGYVTIYEIGGVAANYLTLKASAALDPYPFTLTDGKYIVEMKIEVEQYGERHKRIRVYDSWETAATLLVEFDSGVDAHNGVAGAVGTFPSAGTVGGVWATTTGGAKVPEIEACIINSYQ